VSLCKEAGFSVAALQHDPEFDGDMPDAADFLREQGLAAVVGLWARLLLFALRRGLAVVVGLWARLLLRVAAPAAG
jgi:hypothetical protein